jgi:hypothetical protein
MIFFQSRLMKENKKRSPLLVNVRAAKEARTLDPQLGKLMLYQLSYCRLFAQY